MQRLHSAGVDRTAFVLPALCVAVLGVFWYSERLTDPAPPDGKIHVTYWEKWTDFEFKAIKDVVDDFNRSQNKIQVDILSVSGIEDKTLMAVSAKIPPDLAGLYSNNVTQYADNQAVQPLDQFCQQADIKRDQYIPAFWDMGVVRGHVYALPTAPASTALHYNKTLFRKHGLDPNKPPQTIEELDAMADKLVERDKNGKITVTGFLPSEPGWWNFDWGMFFGGKLLDDQGHLTINSPENVRAFEWVQGYSKRYGAGELQSFRSGFGTFSSPQNAFMTGQNAMELQGVWMYNFINKFNPKLDWGAAPFPYPADRKDLKDTNPIDLDVICIPAGAKHPKEAFEFIKYLESQKGMEKLCLEQRKFTPLINVSPGFIEHHPNPFIKLFIDLAKSKNALSPPKIGIWAEYKDEINNAFDEISLMHKTPKQALDDVVSRMQPMYDSYRQHLKARGLQ